MFTRPPARSEATARGRSRLRLEALEDRLNPVSVVVTSTDDAGAGSLRAAVSAVNASGDVTNAITFNLPAEDTSWDIYLQSQLNLNANVTITGPRVGSLPLLTIHGKKPGFLFDGYRVFTVGAGQRVSLTYLNLADGNAPSSDPNGGLIKVSKESMQAVGVTVRGSPLSLPEACDVRHDSRR